MKILHVIPFLSPKFGGSVTAPYLLSKELAQRNHDVTIITTDYHIDEQYAKSIQSAGVKVISFHCSANIGLFLYTPSLKKWLDKNLNKFDIIHLHNFRSYQNVIVQKFAKKYGIPYVLQAHGSVLPFFEKQNFKKIYDLIWGNNILKDTRKCIAVSNVEREQYKTMEIPESKIIVIPNGIDLQEFDNLPEKGRFREKYRIRSDEKIILFLGRLHKSKGIDFLIQSFSYVSKMRNDIKLIIAGPDDGYSDTLLRRVKKYEIFDEVIFPGLLLKKEKYEALVDADVLVYPGIFEIFGLVPFEAIMCGTPVIVTDDCGCGEIVKDAECGYLVKFGDVNTLADLINDILTNPEKGRERVNKGKKYIKDKLAMKIIIAKVEELYANCLYHI